MEDKATQISREMMLREFANPPSDYAPLDCWWWEAGRLDRKQMTWQLEELKAKGISGTWYYPRFSFGEPLCSDPPYWSEEWWEFTKFAMEEHRRLGLRAWFSDWTAHKFFQNMVREDREKYPSLTGQRLVIREAESNGEEPVHIELPSEEKVLQAAAYRKENGSLDTASRKDLTDAVEDNRLSWKAPEPGWLVTVVASQPHDLDYLNRNVAERWLEVSMEAYRKRLKGLLGGTLEAYGPDEMITLNGNILYSDSLVVQFKEEKGYDPLDHLVGIFHDTGPVTDKIRCDYYEVMVSLLDENWNQAIPKWLKDHGMLYTAFCPYGKDGDLLTQTYHFGDFFRRMGHFDIPGSEEQMRRPVNLTFFAKTASSIAHLYGHSRVGVCAYWGSGWGHTTEENLAWTNENFVYGVNFYNRHGVLYTTLGGWYEWVPPAVHFRQPYWGYWKHFADYVRRLSYIMSRGVHVPDVAILYPLSTIHAGWSGHHNFTKPAQEAASVTGDLARHIFMSQIDFDYIDDPSLCRAEVSDGKLEVSGLEFRALLLPPMTTIRTETATKIKAFYEGGGTVLAFGRLPDASQENGRDDPELLALFREIFGISPGEDVDDISQRENRLGGKAIFVPGDMDRLPEVISKAIDLDVITSDPDILHTHQKMGEVEIYFLYNAGQEGNRISADLRASGEPEVWNAFTGEAIPLHRFESRDGRTTIRLDMGPNEGALVILRPPRGGPSVLEDNLSGIASVESSDAGIRVRGSCDAGGTKSLRLVHRGREYGSELTCDDPPEPMSLEGPWGIRLDPTMDNRWGDFRYPASDEFIGPEARRFHYMENDGREGTELRWHEPDIDDSDWETVTYSYGPYWWMIGPFEEGAEPEEILRVPGPGETDLNGGYEDKGGEVQWHRYSYSRQFGYEGVGIPRELNGVPENFIVLEGVEGFKSPTRFLLTHVYSPDEQDYIFDFGGKAELHRQAWINGDPVISVSSPESEARTRVRLRKGLSSVLLKIIQPEGKRVDTYAIFHSPTEKPFLDPYIPLLRWFVKPHKLTYNIRPDLEAPVGWYRFKAPPGLRAMRFKLTARSVRAWVDGHPVSEGALRVDPSRELRVCLEDPKPQMSQVVLCVEQEPGFYGGATFLTPVMFECDPGVIRLGDWCNSGLMTYSGGAVYTTTVSLEQRHLQGPVVLDLGRAAALADLRVNGKSAGVRMGRPYRFDIGDLVVQGENIIEVKVVNTLANHMSTYPTKFVYEGQTVSGLLGPVELRFHTHVEMTALPVEA